MENIAIMKMKINRKHFKTGLLKVYRWPAVSVASFTRKADSLCQPQTTASESLRLGVLPVIPMSSGLKLNIQKTKIMASGAITSWQIDGETVKDFILGGSKITADGDCSHEIKMLAPWKKSYDQPRQHIKVQRHLFDDKGPSSQSYGFFSSHVLM